MYITVYDGSGTRIYLVKLEELSSSADLYKTDGLIFMLTWPRAEIRTHRDLSLVLQGRGSRNRWLIGRVLGWLMDSGRLVEYKLARRLELEAEDEEGEEEEEEEEAAESEVEG